MRSPYPRPWLTIATLLAFGIPLPGWAQTSPSAPAKKPSAPARAPRAAPAAKQPEEKTKLPAEAPAGSRRDPFVTLIARPTGRGGTAEPPVSRLPRGIGGLTASTIRIDGICRAPSGMIAIVSSPQRETHFVREGEQLFDATVQQITMKGITLRVTSRDAFGKPLVRTESLLLYPSAGEQQ